MNNDPGVLETIAALFLSLLLPFCSLPADTPLHSAARNGDVQKLQQLINDGSDLEQLTRGKETALHHTVQRARYKSMQVLLAAGANIQAKEQHGWTALHLATIYGPPQAVYLKQSCGEHKLACNLQQAQQAQLQMLQVLLDAGADLNALDNNGKTPMQLAAEFERPDMVEALRQHAQGLPATSSQ